jgi:hypothetical protein
MDSVPNSIGGRDFIEVIAQGSSRAGRGAAARDGFLDALVQHIQQRQQLSAWLREAKGCFSDDMPGALLSALRQAAQSKSHDRPEPERRPEPKPRPEPEPKPEPSPRPEPPPPQPEPPQPQEAAHPAEDPPADVAAAPVLDRADGTGRSEDPATRPEPEASSETGSSGKPDERADGPVEARSSAPDAKPAESPQPADSRPEPEPERAEAVRGSSGDVVESDAAGPFRTPPEGHAEAAQPAEGGDGSPEKPAPEAPLEPAEEAVVGTGVLVQQTIKQSPDDVQATSAPATSDAAPEPKAPEAVVGPQSPTLEQPSPVSADDSAAQQTGPTTDEEAPEEVQPASKESSAAIAPNTGHVPLDQHASRPEAGHGAEPSADDGAARELPLASAEAGDALFGALGARVQAPAVSPAASADAVSAIDSSFGADGAGDGGSQIGPRAFAPSALAPGAATPSGDGAAEAEAVEQLDSVFRQVLSTAALPHELRNRIELARSIGRQVIRSALVSVKNGQTHVLVQLRPPTLGTVHMQLTTDGKAVSAKLSVESGLVRQAVEQHVSQLRHVLRDQGFSLERFDVSVRRDGGSEPWASGHADEHGRHGAHAGEHEAGYDDDESAALLDVTASAASTHEGAVDYLA